MMEFFEGHWSNRRDNKFRNSPKMTSAASLSMGQRCPQAESAFSSKNP